MGDSRTSSIPGPPSRVESGLTLTKSPLARLYNFGGDDWTVPPGPGMSGRASPATQWSARLDKLINKISQKHAASFLLIPI